MESSLSHLVNNLMEGIHKISYKGCSCFLEYNRVKCNLIIYVYLAVTVIEKSLLKN